MWRPVQDGIEQRWRARFGGEQVGILRAGLPDMVDEQSLDLPDYLTSLYGGFASEPPAGGDHLPRRLPPPLSQVLHGFAPEGAATDRTPPPSASVSDARKDLRALDLHGLQSVGIQPE